jgi:hypothetical protein
MGKYDLKPQRRNPPLCAAGTNFRMCAFGWWLPNSELEFTHFFSTDMNSDSEAVLYTASERTSSNPRASEWDL